jgi:hypothetical protein
VFVKLLVRIALGTVFVATIALLIFVLVWHRDKEAWSTIAAALAVVAAVIAVLPALRVLELQEDALRPRPEPFFDLTSRYSLHQLRVKNFGGSVAYDVRLRWDDHPINHEGEKITSLDHIAVLLPGESVSVLVGASIKTVRQYGSSRFTGKVQFRDATGKIKRHPFVCSVDADQRRLHHDNEMIRTLYDLQKIPSELSKISGALQQLKNAEQGNSGQVANMNDSTMPNL